MNTWKTTRTQFSHSGWKLFLLLPSVIAGVLIAVWPEAVTFLVATMGGLLVIAQPLFGLILVLITFYFPLLPNLELGPWETSVSAPLVLILALTCFVPYRRRMQRERLSINSHHQHFGQRLSLNQQTTQREKPKPLLARWQSVLLMALLFTFGMSTLFSQNYEATIQLLPNLAIYLITLFMVMVFVDRPERMVLIAKVTLILAFLLTLWRIELRPLRLVLGLPSLGINGAVFNWHPAFAISLVILFLPQSLFSLRWRWFAGLTLISIVLHGFLYQSRAGWLAWMCIILVLQTRLSLKSWLRMALLALFFALFIAVQYVDVLQQSWVDTQTAWEAVTTGDLDQPTESGDKVRIVGQEAAIRMFLERPLFGWGPQAYSVQISNFASNQRYAYQGGAFNAWLQTLAEMGVLGGVLLPLLFLYPCWTLWRKMSVQRDEVTFLAFGFALGALGLFVHLLFINLLHSFAYFYAGLALTAVRISTMHTNGKSTNV